MVDSFRSFSFLLGGLSSSSSMEGLFIETSSSFASFVSISFSFDSGMLRISLTENAVLVADVSMLVVNESIIQLFPRTRTFQLASNNSLKNQSAYSSFKDECLAKLTEVQSSPLYLNAK